MRKKIFPAIIVALALLTVVITALVRSGRSIHKFTAELYFFNEAGTSLMAESREIKYRTESDLPREVIEALIKGPDYSDKRRIFENNTDILDIDMTDRNNIVVNFSEKYRSDDATKDMMTAYAVVKSLCGIYYVNSVKVTACGRNIINPDGKPIGYLTSADINLVTDTNTTEAREVKLYFAKKDYDKLVGEMRTIMVTDQQPIEQYIINELIKGPDNKDNERTLSPDTVLISVDIEDGICFVNFKPNFLDKNSGSQKKEILAVYSIIDSLTELDSVQRVQFLFGGKKVDMLGTININSMFGRNEDMIEE